MASSSSNPAVRPHVVVATSGTGGDIYPFVLLAHELSRRGHRVTVLAPASHASLVQAHDLDHRSFGSIEAFQALLADPELWDEKKGFGVVWRGLAPHFGVVRDLLAQLPADAPCVVLCHPFLVPMADIARAVRPGLKIVACYLAPSNLCSSHDMLTAGSQRIPSWMPLSWKRTLWKIIHKTYIDPVTLPSLNAYRAANGLAPAGAFFEHMFEKPDQSIGLFPEWFAAPQPDWPSPFVTAGFPVPPGPDAKTLAPELERFLGAGDAPVGFTPGTGHKHSARYFEHALRALKRLGRRGLFITPFYEQVPGNLPPEIMWIAQAPFNQLLPRLAALVHHGGIGTTADSFRAGIPQVITPFAFDQFDNGWRAQRLGVAEVLLPGRVTDRRIAAALGRLLASDHAAQRCKTLAASTNAQSMSALVDQVQEALMSASATPEELALAEA